MFKKVIIYGHKLHSHTHSYIHQAFYKAFLKMGYETLWLDKNDKFENYDFSNSLFLTEGQVIDNIPVRSDCKYLLHFVDKDTVKKIGLDESNVLNFKFFENESTKYEKINDFSFYDRKSNILYFPWAATLFPDQIDKCSEKLFNPKERDVNFIGSVWDVNVEYIKKFKESCTVSNKNFHWRRLLNDKEYFYYTVKSYATVDFRGELHLNIGYLPCRIFKALSYGIVPGTNSEHVKKAFGEYVYFNENPGQILEGTAEFWKSKDKKDIRAAMNFVKENHTYINRINDIFEVLK